MKLYLIISELLAALSMTALLIAQFFRSYTGLHGGAFWVFLLIVLNYILSEKIVNYFSKHKMRKDILLGILLLFAGYTQAQTVNVSKSTSTQAVAVYTTKGADTSTNNKIARALKTIPVPTTAGVPKTYVDSLFNSLVGNMTELFKQTANWYANRDVMNARIKSLEDSLAKFRPVVFPNDRVVKGAQVDSVFRK